MPSTMIHMLVAHEIEPDSDGLFWAGGFAPDYTNDRAKKDAIHLRDAQDRREALLRLRSSCDMASPFDRGWVLHMYTDALWDDLYVKKFANEYVPKPENDPGWFREYRRETGDASYYLHHNLPWAAYVWRKVASADISRLKTCLPITPEECLWYAERVAKRHAESPADSFSKAFPPDMLISFAKNTAEEYRAWIK